MVWHFVLADIPTGEDECSKGKKAQYFLAKLRNQRKLHIRGASRLSKSVAVCVKNHL